MEEQEILKGRLTAKKLVTWCNWKFEQIGLNEYEVTEIVRTNFRGQDYEAGACKLYVRFRHKNSDNPLFESQFLCFYSIGEYADYLKKGYSLKLVFQRGHSRSSSMTDLEIDVVKS